MCLMIGHGRKRRAKIAGWLVLCREFDNQIFLTRFYFDSTSGPYYRSLGQRGDLKEGTLYAPLANLGQNACIKENAEKKV